MIDQPNSLYAESLEVDYYSLLEGAQNRLETKTNITSFSAGSIAKSVLELYYEDMESLYQRIAKSEKRSRLSSASGQYLEEFGYLMNCDRPSEEDDEQYRARIHNQPVSQAKANETAVKQACRDVDGVNDVKIKRFARGIGTFDVYIISDNPDTPQTVVNQVQHAIETNQAYGMRGKAIKPKLVTVDIYAQYIFFDTASSSMKSDIRNQAEETLRQFFVNKELGSELVINNIIDILMDIDNKFIKDVMINELYLNKRQTIIDNKEFYWDERLVPENIIIS
jgi:hypothetical protein